LKKKKKKTHPHPKLAFPQRFLTGGGEARIFFRDSSGQGAEVLAAERVEGRWGPAVEAEDAAEGAEFAAVREVEGRACGPEGHGGGCPGRTTF